jgi:hypothetical protein
LPIFNGRKWLADAIRSVLGQTYPHWELIAIDDGSSDGSHEVVANFSDRRIRLHRQANSGLPATLNRAIGLARGDYIARQDQDDISLPERFEKQVAFFDSQPSCGMVGTWAEIWVGDQTAGRAHKHPSDNIDLQFDLLVNNPFVHSSMMIRKTVFEKVGWYSTDPARQPPEDYELWSRVARRYEIGNIPEILHVYREVCGSMSRNGANPFLDHLIMISAENLAWATGQPRPTRAHRDVAALANGAVQRIAARPRLKEMHHLLTVSAERLCARFNVPRDALAQRAHNLSQSLERHYRVKWRPPMFRAMYEYARACYRKLRWHGHSKCP